MNNHTAFLTGLDKLREWVSPWVGFLIALLSLLAFWPRIKASVVGRLTTENIRLRGLIADMTIEESVKNVIIAANKKTIEDLEGRIIVLHREQIDEITRPDNPKSSRR